MRSLRISCCILFLVVIASASPAHSWKKVTVLDSETRSVEGPADVPRDCTFWDYDAYCQNSSPKTYVEKLATVREADGKTLKVECTIFNPWTYCPDLSANETVEAKRVKRGIEILYQGRNHKQRKAVYEIVGVENRSTR